MVPHPCMSHFFLLLSRLTFSMRCLSSFSGMSRLFHDPGAGLGHADTTMPSRGFRLLVYLGEERPAGPFSSKARRLEPRQPGGCAYNVPSRITLRVNAAVPMVASRSAARNKNGKHGRRQRQRGQREKKQALSAACSEASQSKHTVPGPGRSLAISNRPVCG